jgi:hypothetical protein
LHHFDIDFSLFIFWLQQKFNLVSSVFLSVCPSIRLFVCLPVCQYISLFLLVTLFVCLPICPFVLLSFCPSVNLPFCPSVLLSVYSSICLFHVAGTVFHIKNVFSDAKKNFFWNPNYLHVDVLVLSSGVTSVLYSQKA